MTPLLNRHGEKRNWRMEKCPHDILLDWTLETRRMLLTNVTPTNFRKSQQRNLAFYLSKKLEKLILIWPRMYELTKSMHKKIYLILITNFNQIGKF